MDTKFASIADEFSAIFTEQADSDRRLASWRGEVTFPSDGTPYERNISTTKYTGHKLSLSSTEFYDGMTQKQLHDYITKNLPTANYSIDQRKQAERGSDTWIYGNSDVFEDVSFTVREIERAEGITGFAEIEGDLDFTPTR